jgi:hypothetical protein
MCVAGMGGGGHLAALVAFAPTDPQPIHEASADDAAGVAPADVAAGTRRSAARRAVVTAQPYPLSSSPAPMETCRTTTGAAGAEAVHGCGHRTRTGWAGRLRTSSPKRKARWMSIWGQCARFVVCSD